MARLPVIQPCESVTALSEVDGKVLVAGSHGGLVAASYAAKALVHAVIFNDAGIGLDEAGVLRVADTYRDPVPGGRVAVIDFTMETRSGPPRAERIAPDRVKAEMAAAGYQLTDEFKFLPEQFFLVFTASKP